MGKLGSGTEQRLPRRLILEIKSRFPQRSDLLQALQPKRGKGTDPFYTALKERQPATTRGTSGFQLCTRKYPASDPLGRHESDRSTAEPRGRASLKPHPVRPRYTAGLAGKAPTPRPPGAVRDQGAWPRAPRGGSHQAPRVPGQA